MLPSCVTEEIKRQPVPMTGSLRSDDCKVGIDAYRALLQLPPNAGVVVTDRPPPPVDPLQQELGVAEFANHCQTQLVGKARRALVRCWTDSADANSFRSCNDRF